MTRQRLGSGPIGSGFITRFHIGSLVGVRDADVRGCWSPAAAHAESAALARELDVGEARAFPSLQAMVSDPAVDAVWLCGPNHARLANLEAICAAVRSGATLRGVACEKPLARTVAEAKRMLALTEKASTRWPSTRSPAASSSFSAARSAARRARTLSRSRTPRSA